jgi:hypothetical protein
MIIYNAKMSTANTQGTGGGERNMQMNSSSTRFLVACRDAGIARAGDFAPAEPKAISSVLRAVGSADDLSF